MNVPFNINLLSIFLIGFALLIGCQKDDSNNSQTTSQLVLSPEKLMVNDNDTTTLYLSIQPPGEFTWNLSSKPDWIDINPKSGSLNKDIVVLQITPNSTGLSAGKYIGKIEIITNGAGKAESIIEYCVDPHPNANVDPTELLFLADETEKTLTITNDGTGFLNWNIQSLPSWVTLSTTSGSLSEGEKISIIASALRNSLPVGTQTTIATLISNSVAGNIPIGITLQVPSLTLMTSSVQSVDFGYFENKQSFYIKNEGNVSFNWDWNSNQSSIISLLPNSGTLEKGDSTKITVSVDRSNLSAQPKNIEININNNNGQTITLPVNIEYNKEEKLLITGKVVDAEYDRVNDVLILVCESPNEIRKYNLSNNTIESLALNTPPTCVSVGKDGDFAAVGHNGRFSYINLSSMILEKNYSITTDALDIVLAPNDWVYVFPKVDQWENIRCIKLSTSIEKLHSGNAIYAGTKGKLHPSGKYIYGANNGLSPSDFEKYDISFGTAEYLYDSPYHGNFNFDGDLWVSDDGNRLFAKSRNVFNASSIKANDMTYSGELIGEGKVVTLDYSLKAKKVYTIFTEGNFWDGKPSNEIRKYDTEFLGFLGTITLPGFLIPDGSGSGTLFNSQGHFGFFNSQGTKYYVLVKVQEGSGAQNEWAIATIDVE